MKLELHLEGLIGRISPSDQSEESAPGGKSAIHKGAGKRNYRPLSGKR